MDLKALLAPLLAPLLQNGFSWVASVGGLAVAIPLGIEALKRWKRIPFLDENTVAINRVVAILAATFASAGISYTYNDTVGEFLVTGVTPIGIAHFLIDVALQFGLQELAYKYLVQGKLKR